MEQFYKSSLFGGRDILPRLVAIVWSDVGCWSTRCKGIVCFNGVRSELPLLNFTEVYGLLAHIFVVSLDEVRSELSSLTEVSGLLKVGSIFSVDEVRSELSSLT